MRMMHIYNGNKYRSIICRVSQNQRNNRKIKTDKFLFFLFSIFVIISFSITCNMGVYQMRGNHTVTMFMMRVKSCHHMRGLSEGQLLN